MRFGLALAIAAALGGSPSGCRRPASSEQELVERAQFGVFYGGQVQELDEIPFIIDRARQSHGFRLEFPRPLPQPVTVEWEVDMPGTSWGVRDGQNRIGQGRLVKLDRAIVLGSRSRFDQVLDFRPGDPLGTWNIRVLMEGRLLIDRSFLVYDPVARSRIREDGGP